MWLPDSVVSHLRVMAAEPDLSGTRYSLRQRIADGGMGTVWRVEDRVLKRDVALKVLHIEDPSGEAGARLEREAQILAALEHPGIVPVYDAGTLASGRPFYCMRLVEGRNLRDFARESATLQHVLAVFLRICEAVAFAHSRGMVHRDLKPDNVMIGAFGEVFVMDWGVAKVLDENAVLPPEALRTLAGTIAGTPGFAAPEQVEGRASDVDERADVYSLGMLLHFMLSDRKPAPRRLKAIVARACRTAPEDRYKSAAMLAEDISRFLEGEPVEAYRELPHERLARFMNNNRVLMALIATYIAVRVLIFIFGRL